MASPRHLNNAPITEAIFDFRVKARPEFRAEELEHLRSQLADRFPKVENRHHKQATFVFPQKGESPPPLVQDLGLQGYLFKTADEKTITQVRVDGFTLNRLRPYTSWDELFPLAIELWQRYSVLARPEAITRLAVRYINRIPLPIEPVDLDLYLRAAPVSLPELPQNLINFLTRVTIEDPTKDITAHITQASGGIEASGQQPFVILDIDVFKQGLITIDDPTITTVFTQLRELKNRIFFSSLTEETVRKFE